ncbi:MAG TPA: hypothetical protein VNT27_16350, partial [Propionibacteriaceae bacterium]|nr:hypothetical protein [Propionibacteriaceae bacterium]
MDREVVHPADAKSGAVFERFRADGRAYFVKRTSPERDWIMRVTGDRDFRTHRIWRAGILHRAAAVVEHAIVDVTVEGGELVVLMRDVGDALVPPGDGIVPQEQHRALLTGLAGLSALFAGWR